MLPLLTLWSSVLAWISSALTPSGARSRRVLLVVFRLPLLAGRRAKCLRRLCHSSNSTLLLRQHLLLPFRAQLSFTSARLFHLRWMVLLILRLSHTLLLGWDVFVSTKFLLLDRTCVRQLCLIVLITRDTPLLGIELSYVSRVALRRLCPLLFCIRRGRAPRLP